ncbi:MAG TPA: hypothetical protein VFY78_01210, partial [Gammaproteobacteria bacterium]|nr:hypothetical protein [Gammaproteobacteria bacterium]
LFGDPSIHPVMAVPHAFSRTKTYKNVFMQKQNVTALRALRRERMVQVGQAIQMNLGAVIPVKTDVPKQIVKLLESAARESGVKVENAKIQVFGVQYGKSQKTSAMKAFDSARMDRQIYSLTIKHRNNPSAGYSQPRVLGLIATVQAGQVIHLRRLHSR